MSDVRAAIPGRILTLVGADGAGKSTQAKRLRARIGARAMYIYMGANPSAITHALPTTRAWTWLKRALGRKVHHEGPPDPAPTPRPSRAVQRGLQHLKSFVALGLRVSEDLYRLSLAELYARRDYLVIIDRHPYPDYYARRVRATNEWLRWGDRIHGFLLERVYPHPSAMILLDAPAEVLHARKREGSLTAVQARRQEYLDLTQTLAHIDVTVVDAARSEDEVLANLLRIVRGGPSGEGGGPQIQISKRPRSSHVLLLVCVALVAACDSPADPGDVAEGRDTVTIMTFNIFHDGQNANQGISAWSDRRDAVVATIRSSAPDVLGLQEAEVWQVAWLLAQMPEYAAVARGPFADPNIDDAETVAILYRKDELGAQESGHFWYSSSPDSPGSYGGDDFGGLLAPRMATWVRLRRSGSTTAKGFYVFNTHFTADAGAADPGLARFKSAELLVRRIADRSHADEYFFAIGDLNQPPGGWPLRYLLGSRCESSSACAVPPPVPELRMIDTWGSQHPGNTAGTRCNAVTGGDGSRVDYVLVWDPTPLAAPSISDAEIVHGGSGCPSDHRPVVATIIM